MRFSIQLTLGQCQQATGHTLYIRRLSPIAAADPVAPVADILFDPQTSGGLLAALPGAVAPGIIEAFHQSGQPAAIVGRLNDVPGLTLTDQD